MTALSLPLTRRKTLSRKAAFALLSSAVLTLLASSSAPTPLYATYQARWDFSDVTITVIFGVYAVAVLASLLVFGSLSDHIGRRPVLISALATQALVMLLFAFAGDLDALLLARVLQGLATGAALGAIAAGLVDLHPGRGAIANAASGMAGTASGALGAALLVELLPAPTKLIYLLLSLIFAAQALGVVGAEETSPRKPGAIAALKPVLAIPPRARGALLIAAPSLVAVWALAGFYASLGPSVAAVIAGSNSVLLGGVALFTLAGSGSLTVLIFHAVEPRKFALAGNGLVILGTATVLWAIWLHSIAVFFVGTVISGSGFGAGFQGGLRTIVPLVETHERSGILSVAYLICYLAMGLPAILAGFLVVHSTLVRTTQEFGVAVIVLAATTTAALMLAARRDSRLAEAARRPMQAATIRQTA
jgi:predicted MFS family arabinose efflux permease